MAQPKERWEEMESKCTAVVLWFLTDLYGGLPPQQQFQTFTVVRQAAVVQRCAALDRLLVQIQTAEQHRQRGEKTMKYGIR